MTFAKRAAGRARRRAPARRSKRAHAPAAGAHDRAGDDHRHGADGARPGRRRRAERAAGPRGDRRPAGRHGRDAVLRAGGLRGDPRPPSRGSAASPRIAAERRPGRTSCSRAGRARRGSAPRRLFPSMHELDPVDATRREGPMPAMLSDEPYVHWHGSRSIARAPDLRRRRAHDRRQPPRGPPRRWHRRAAAGKWVAAFADPGARSSSAGCSGSARANTRGWPPTTRELAVQTVNVTHPSAGRPRTRSSCRAI